MRHQPWLVTFVALLAATSHVRAQEIGDAQRGFAFAREVCSECHAVRKGQVISPNPLAPTFVELANTPGMTATALFVALQTPHRTMPNLILGAEQKRNVIAYILSLKRGR